MADPFNPDFRWKLDGVAFDPKAANMVPGRWRAYGPGGEDSTLTFHVGPTALASLPDAYSAKLLTMEVDEGSGYALAFAGRVIGPSTSWTDKGWVHSYTARGLAYLASRVPVTNPVDGTDLVAFNLPPSDPDYRAERAGRAIGDMLLYVLDSPANRSALAAYGVGNYATLLGTGATGRCTVVAGLVGITITNGGSGYSSAQPPNAFLVGGDGTYTGITLTIAGGAVTGATVVGASGWTIPPRLWISGLPTATLRDLAGMTVVPSSGVYIQGEAILDVVDGIITQWSEHHARHVQADGTVRFFDLRTPSTTYALMMNPTAADTSHLLDRVDVGNVHLSRTVEDCYQRVVIRGGPEVRAVVAGLAPPVGSGAADNGLAENFTHDGLSTGALAKLHWSLADYTQPGLVSGQATMTPVMGTGSNAGKVLALTTVQRGYKYTPGVSYSAIIDPPGSGVTGGVQAVAHSVANSDGELAAWVVDTVGQYGATTPFVKAPPPPGSNFDYGRIVSIVPGTSSSVVTVDPAENTKTWAANDYDQTSSGRKGFAFLVDDVTTPGILPRTSGRVLANSALAAGGTSTLTIEGAISTGYDSYELYATCSGASKVWRNYSFTSNLGGALYWRFPQPVPFRFADGSAAAMTSYPVCTVFYSASGARPYSAAPVGIDLDIDARTLTTHVPTVVPFGTTKNLTVGGSATDGIPTDVQALVPVVVGNLTAVYPPNTGYAGTTPAYGGTSYTVDGLAETLTRTIPSWIDPSNQANMTFYAKEVWDAVSPAHVTGSVKLLRYHGGILAGPGRAMTLAAPYATPWDGIPLPVVGATLDFAGYRDDASAKYVTDCEVSNKRVAMSADPFVRPPSNPHAIGSDLADGSFYGLGSSYTPAGVDA